MCLALAVSVGTNLCSAGATTFSLTVSRSDENTQYLPLLPVVLTLELRNNGSATQTVGYRGFGAQSFHDERNLPPRYRFDIEGPNGDARQLYLSDWVNLAPYLSGGNLSESLEAGKSIVIDYCLGFGVDSFPDKSVSARDLDGLAGAAFPTVGEYRVQVTLPRLGSHGLESNELTVLVKAPEKASDILAYRLLSNSRAPCTFLTPPTPGLLGGVSPLGWGRFPKTSGAEWFDIQREMLEETCQEIITRCPGSSYAAYARLFYAKQLCNKRVKPDPKKMSVPDTDKVFEGIALLLQCATDSALPRRYREAGLQALVHAAKEIEQHVMAEAKAKLPTLESVLGESRPDLDETRSEGYYRSAHIAMGTSERAMLDERRLQSRFSPDQVVALKNAVLTNPTIQAALAIAPVQRELQGHVAWSQAELGKLPWRDAAGQPKWRFRIRSDYLD